MANTTSALELKQTSRDVYYAAAPIQASVARNEDEPRVILIFGWMEAQLSHTKKYMDSYAKLYPHAAQILVRSQQNLFWAGSKRKEASVSPAIELLKKEGVFQATPPSILVHVFSNGGAFQLLELSRILKSSGQMLDKPAATAIIYDSVPGKMDLGSTLSAFLAPVRSTFVRILMTIPFTMIYYTVVALTLITRQQPAFERMREQLNKARVLPWTNEKTPRLYIYSDVDKLVGYKAVTEHIVDAKDLGLNVRSEYFKGSSHVAHARADPDRYWGAVKEIWAVAVTME